MNAADIKALLLQNPKAVERAIVVLFQRQTASEQDAGHTVQRNGQGFNAFHANLGTYYAKWILAGKHLDGRHLDKARRISLHYTGQLVQVAIEKAGQAHP